MSAVSKGRWKGVCPEVEGPTESTPKSVATFDDDTGLSLKSNSGVLVDDDQNVELTEGDLLIEDVASPRGVYWTAEGDLASVVYVPASSRLIVSSETDLYLSCGDQLVVDTANGWSVDGISYTTPQIQEFFLIAGLSPSPNDLLLWDGSGWSTYADTNYATASHNHGTGAANEITRWASVNGIQGSGWTIDDDGLMSAPIAVDATPAYSATRYTDGSQYGTIGVRSTGPTFALTAAGTMSMVLDSGGSLLLEGHDNVHIRTSGDNAEIVVHARGHLDLGSGTGGEGDIFIQSAGKLVFSTQVDGEWWVEGVSYTRDQIAYLFSIANNVEGDLFYADGDDSIGRLAKDTAATRYLANTGASNTPAWDRVDLTNGVQGVLPFANLTQIGGTSVLGVPGGSGADVAGISASADGQVLRRAGGSLGFGAIDLASSSAVSGDLPLANLAQVAAYSVLCNPTSPNPGDVSAVALGTNSVIGRGQTGNVVAVSASANTVLGRKSSGGLTDVPCTDAGFALLDDASPLNQRATLGLVIGADVQEWSANLDIFASAAATPSNGYFLMGVGSSAWQTVTPAVARGGLGVTNLDALQALGTGLPARTSSTTWSARTIAAGNGLSVSSGDGVSGNPTVSLATPVSVANGGTGAATIAGAQDDLGLYHRIRTSDANLTAGTPLPADGQLTMTVPSGTYEVTACLMAWRSSGSGNLNYGFSIPGGGSYMRWTGTPGGSGMLNEGSTATVNLAAAQIIWVKGVLVALASGTFELVRGESTTNVVLGAHSYLCARRVG